MSQPDLPTVDDVPVTKGMPMLGLGTWQNEDPEECATAVQTALDMGYRHVDTAQAYGNEADVGDGIERADVDREEVFLATKLWIENLSYQDVLESAYDSLDKLGVESVDLLYVHWPSGEYDPEETFRALDELHDEGAIDRVGVSNFRPEDLDRAMEVSDAPIFANQVEMHPLLPQRELRDYCASNDIELVAYSPLARGAVFEVPELNDITDQYEASAAQVSLAWLREKGVTAIPKATTEAHIRDNWRSVGLILEEGDIRKIDEIDRVERQVDPGFAPWN